jgi:flagellum-specific ATP synthase
VTDPEQQQLAGELRRLMAAHAEARDLIEIGAYVPGTNPTVDRAVALREPIQEFLRQRIDHRVDAPDAFRHLATVLGQPS